MRACTVQANARQIVGAPAEQAAAAARKAAGTLKPGKKERRLEIELEDLHKQLAKEVRALIM